MYIKWFNKKTVHTKYFEWPIYYFIPVFFTE